MRSERRPHRAQASISTATRLSVLVLMLAAIIIVPARANAQATAPLTLQASPASPTPDQDDATLRAVTAVGQVAWAVGDRGVIWKSNDGGQSWQFINLPPEARTFSFQSVCFLTDRVGWIAGGTVIPVGGVLQGIVLSTKDGGATWQVQPGQGLPYVRHVQFFDLHHGILVGGRTNSSPGGALRTTDGGRTWSPLPSQRSGSWNTAAFLSADRGVLGGDQNRQAVIDRSSLLPSGSGATALTGWQGSSIDAQGQAWMVGDGATVVRSLNFGVSWQPLRDQLPQFIDDFTDFTAVAQRGQHVWIAGHPGSVIWKSSDGGEHWEPQQTGEAVPLTSLHFSDEQLGIAVGHLGRISVTRDGGQTWQNARAAGRRLATLALQSHEDQAALPYIARWAGEDGFRTAVIVTTRRDIGDDAHRSQELRERLSHAVQTAGGNDGWVDWKLPISLPLLNDNEQRLLEEWTQLTDRRLGDVLLASLVGQIRTWRPSVILIDAPDGKNAAAQLIDRAMSRAIILAADPEFGLEQTQICGLAPWKVEKLVLQRNDGQPGIVRVDLFEPLRYRRSTVEMLVARAAGQLTNSSGQFHASGEFWIDSRRSTAGLSERNIFIDLNLRVGGDARRALPVISNDDSEQIAKEAQHRRHVTAASERIINDPQRSGQLLGQLNDIVRPLSPEQAAQQLSVLGEMYHRQGEWALAEEVYSELITRYPDQPPAAQAMLWLLKYWSSAEMNWQRLKTIQSQRVTTRAKPLNEGVIQTAVEAALEAAKEKQNRMAYSLAAPPLPAAIESNSHDLPPTMGDLRSVTTADGQAGSPQQMLLTRWQTGANAIVKTLNQAYPQLAQQPETQFVTAALMRRRGDHRKADEIYREFMKTLSDDPWNIAARGESFLLRPGAQAPKPTILCKRVASPPHLDGLLSDPCWVGATEIRLGEEQSETYVGSESLGGTAKNGNVPRPVILMARDERFLYLAATVPIESKLPSDGPQTHGRTHDSDLGQFDRLCFQFDVDRDYATYYQFTVDQRGHTRDACWEDHKYNPQWFVASTRSTDAWRMECAIPLDELLPADRIAGTSWGVGITRIMPGIGSQGWTASGAVQPRPELFGLVRFE